MSRKEVWDKALNRHGKVKVYSYLACLPVILPIYAVAFVLIFVGAIGEGIKFKLDNI